MKQIVNGVEVDLTPEEIDEYNLRQAEWSDGAQSRMFIEFQSELEKTIDAKAAEKSYSSGVSCASYKDSTNPQWAAEAQAFIEWRDNCYEYGYDYLAKVQGGIILNPTLEDFIDGVPTMTWPTVN